LCEGGSELIAGNEIAYLVKKLGAVHDPLDFSAEK